MNDAMDASQSLLQPDRAVGIIGYGAYVPRYRGGGPGVDRGQGRPAD